MEKARICKICNKRFSNGKAMGGHMRSHFAKLPLPPKTPQLHSPSSSSSSLPFPNSSAQNPSRSYRSVNHDLLHITKPNHNHPVNGDENTEIESPRSTTRRRSKRRRRQAESAVKAADTSPELASSLSNEILNDEDVALCLLMLSKDTKGKEKVCDESDRMEMELEIDDDADEVESFDEIPLRSRANGRYKCPTCKKLFRSYQALGGHKASHKKVKKEDNGGASSSAVVLVDQRIYVCPFCDKVFYSGQALGGHKKVHFSYLGNNNATKSTIPSETKHAERSFDLNLPAPEEEEDDDEVGSSQVYQHRNGN